jgi:hypothetical protein
MKKALQAGFLGVVMITGEASAGTSFRSTWRAPDAKPGTFRGKMVVAIYITQDEPLRQGVEITLANELKKRGVEGVAAYKLIPTDEMRDEAKAKARLSASGAAGVVTLRLVGDDQEISSSPATYYSAPQYNSLWGGYWGYGWGVYHPGYVSIDRIFHVETLVYSLEQNKLVWAGQSKSTNPDSVDSFIKDLVGKVASEMKKAGLIQNGR